MVCILVHPVLDVMWDRSGAICFTIGSHSKNRDLHPFLVNRLCENLLLPTHPFFLIKDEQIHFFCSTPICIPGNLFNSFADGCFPGTPHHLTFDDKTLGGTIGKKPENKKICPSFPESIFPCYLAASIYNPLEERLEKQLWACFPVCEPFQLMKFLGLASLF